MNDPLDQIYGIDGAAHEAATSPISMHLEPTEAQKEAGNYRKGHVPVQGLALAIENPRGSTRSGLRPDGSAWSHVMSNHYGYIKRTVGADDEQIDVYLGPQPDSDRVFIVDQLDQESGGFDEQGDALLPEPDRGRASLPLELRSRLEGRGDYGHVDRSVQGLAA